MLSIPLRMIACVHEPSSALRLWKGLRVAAQADFKLSFARGVDELCARVEAQDPHILLFEAGQVDHEGPSLVSAMELAPRAKVILIGERAAGERARLDAQQRERVVLLAELLAGATPPNSQI